MTLSKDDLSRIENLLKDFTKYGSGYMVKKVLYRDSIKSERDDELHFSSSDPEKTREFYEHIVDLVGKPNSVNEMFVGGNGCYCLYVYYDNLMMYIDGYVYSSCKLVQVKETVTQVKYKCISA